MKKEKKYKKNSNVIKKIGKFILRSSLFKSGELNEAY